ncbi:MAG: hypothetical protein K6L81_02520 [Agarilytica sp.]
MNCIEVVLASTEGEIEIEKVRLELAKIINEMGSSLVIADVRDSSNDIGDNIHSYMLKAAQEGRNMFTQEIELSKTA